MTTLEQAARQEWELPIYGGRNAVRRAALRLCQAHYVASLLRRQAGALPRRWNGLTERPHMNRSEMTT